VVLYAFRAGESIVLTVSDMMACGPSPAPSAVRSHYLPRGSTCLGLESCNEVSLRTVRPYGSKASPNISMKATAHSRRALCWAFCPADVARSNVARPKDMFKT